jgi:hypothetical protein
VPGTVGAIRSLSRDKVDFTIMEGLAIPSMSHYYQSFYSIFSINKYVTNQRP